MVDRPEIEVQLRLARALSIDGVVFGGPYQSVIARPVDPTALPLAVMSRRGGEFLFESVAPGMYEVYAISDEGRSASAFAQAGTRGIELEFPAKEGIHLILRGIAPEARRTLALVHAEFQCTMSGASKDLDFAIVPDTSVHVTSGDEIGIVNGASERLAPSGSVIVLDLEPGATLTAVNAAAEPLDLRVWSDDCLLLLEHLLRGESEQVLVPAGAVRAELLDGQRLVASEIVTLAPRERRRLVLAPE